MTLDVSIPSPLLQDLLPDTILTAQRACDLEAPWPEERRHVEAAVLSRRLEFGAGRHCAQAVLGKLEAIAAPLLAGADGAPLWPFGIAGSIAHTGTMAVAAAMRVPENRQMSLGVDIEDGEVRPAVWPILFTAGEIAALNPLSAAMRAHTAAILFSAKEAFFKAQWPLTRSRLDFRDVHCAIDHDGTFKITPPPSLVSLLPTMLAGRYAVFRNGVATAIVLQ